MLKYKKITVFCIGFCGLVAGLFIYITSRPFGSTYIHKYIMCMTPYFLRGPDIFGFSGQ